MNTKVTKEELIYLYCITDKVPKLKEIENLVDKPYFIYHQSLYAIVNKVKESEFGEENLKRNLADLEWISHKASIHEKAIEGIMKNACVIPFKLATLFNTEDNLKETLKEHLSGFKEALDYLEGKEERGVKIYCDIERLKDNLIKENTELLNIEKEITRSQEGKAFILKKKKEELLNSKVLEKVNEYGQRTFERLKGHSIDSCINKLLPKEVTEKKEEMILNSAFLIAKDKVIDFINIVDNLRSMYSKEGFTFDCTGPWPPYNFVTTETRK